MKFGFGGELHDRFKKNIEKRKNQDKEKKHEYSKNYITYPLLSVLRPEKAVFSVFYDHSGSDKIHKFKPFVGL